MDTGLLIALIAIAVVVAVIALVGARKARAQRDEGRRIEAREHREEAGIRAARADAQEAEAEERAARARREQAHAEEQAALARQERRAADERHEHADRLDPDVEHRRDERSVADAGDREHHGDEGAGLGRRPPNGGGSVPDDTQTRR